MPFRAKLRRLFGGGSQQHLRLPKHPAGAVLGGYRVIKHLGSGSFSHVYLVESLSGGRRHALKQTLITELSEAERKAAVNELRLLASLHHPHVVQYHGGFVDGECLCVVMDLMSGGTLEDVIRAAAEAGRQLPEDEVWTHLLQLADGLAHLHSNSIIHRDIKPANVLVGAKGLLKIGDLGTASVLTGVCVRLQMGTPGWMAPELFRKECQTFAADIFSLGCLLYLMCTLRPLFASRADVEAAALRWGPSDAAEAAAALSPAYTAELQGLLQTMLQSDPEARPTALSILERHMTPERLARLPAAPEEDACGRSWAESKGARLLNSIVMPSSHHPWTHADMEKLGAALPKAGSNIDERNVRRRSLEEAAAAVEAMPAGSGGRTEE